MKELITVVINVYNGEKFIKKCLDSVVNQTYKNIEILIINDGSTDNTLDICKSYKDDRIRIITTENLGLSMSRNVGIDNAKGEYLYFVDVDDYVENDAIEYLYNLCKKYNTLMATCQPITIYDYDIIINNPKEKVDVISDVDMLKKVLLSSEDRAITIWNKLIKKELFNNIRFENRPINDIAVTYKLALTTDRIAYSNQIKYYYLRNKNSITVAKKTDIDRGIDRYKVTLERYDYIKKIYPDLIENNIGLLRTIALLYSEGKDEMCKYLKKEGALKLYKKLFSIKILKCKLKKSEKIRMILFRINPKICRVINNKYQSIKYTYKK